MAGKDKDAPAAAAAPAGAKKGKKGDALVQKSPAEFFAENKNIAGFDNVRGSTRGGPARMAAPLPQSPPSI